MPKSLTELLSIVPPEFRDTAKIYAEYSLLWLPLSATAASAKATVQTQDDSYFLATRMKAYVTDNATPPAEIESPELSYLLKIASNNIQPDNNAVHIGNIVTTKDKDGGEDLDFPIWIPPSTTLTALMNNLTGATAMNVYVKVCGIRFLTNVKGSLR